MDSVQANASGKPDDDKTDILNSFFRFTDRGTTVELRASLELSTLGTRQHLIGQGPQLPAVQHPTRRQRGQRPRARARPRGRARHGSRRQAVLSHRQLRADRRAGRADPVLDRSRPPDGDRVGAVRARRAHHIARQAATSGCRQIDAPMLERLAIDGVVWGTRDSVDRRRGTTSCVAHHDLGRRAAVRGRRDGWESRSDWFIARGRAGPHRRSRPS